MPRNASIASMTLFFGLAAGHAAAAPASSTALLALPASSASPVIAPLPQLYPELEAFYFDLHSHPELSFQEVRTAEKLAGKLRALGYEVTTGLGKTGIAAVMRNGKGPTLLIRADMDALPVQEKTGVPYASTATAQNETGDTVPVMHACGHDVHMTTLVGTATLLARARNRWRGTLVLIGQPAEEGGGGASAMIRDGLFDRVPRPDFAIALHDSAWMPAGKVGVTPGYALANSDRVTITVYGRGGHGSAPQSTVDPIVVAARIVTTLQTIVSRETSPQDPAVVTVGSIHGGTRANIIPDEVRLELTVRSFTPQVRERLLASIARIAKAEAAAAAAPKEPLVVVSPGGYKATYNDPGLSERVAAAFERTFGKANVVAPPPVLGAEDFGDFGRATGAPSLMFWLGAVPAATYAAADGDPARLPSLHSPFWAPDPEPTIETGAAALTAAAMEVLSKP